MSRLCSLCSFFWTVSAFVNYVDSGLSPACQESCNLPAPPHYSKKTQEETQTGKQSKKFLNSASLPDFYLLFLVLSYEDLSHGLGAMLHLGVAGR